MAAHTDEQFKTFVSQLQETNYSLDLFCDFKKIERNVSEIKLSLCILNSLIGAKDLRSAVDTIWKRDKSAFQVMDILIAVRKKDKKKYLDSLSRCTLVDSLFNSVDGVMKFLKETGLAEIFRDGKIQNLVDYVFGIETGLDSNTRKNRSGRKMSNLVEAVFNEHHVSFRKEVCSSEWPEIANALGNDKKRFDYVISNSGTTYLVEVNFYNSGGSKPNEVSRSYSEIAHRINSVPNFEFVWITDGKGWNRAKGKLEEAYKLIPRMYNLTNMREFLKELEL